jgi:large subunit ribosomal protein L29
MKIKEIRDKKTEAIHLELKDLQKHLFDLRTQAVTEKLENPSLLRKTRKDIARFKTVLRQRQLEETGKRPAKVIKEDQKPAKAKPKIKSRGKANVK